jgi:Mg-chelatase subunit ChlD
MDGPPSGRLSSRRGGAPAGTPPAVFHLILGSLTLALALVMALAWPAPRATHAGQPVAPPGAVCDLFTDKTTHPAEVFLGQEVEITLSLDGRCPEGGSDGKADILLALDASASQHDNGTWEPTVRAAATFLDLMDFGRVQVGLLTFSGGLPLLEPETVLVQPLSADGAAVKAALAGLPEARAWTGPTNLTAAVQASQRELTSPRHRADAQPVLVLLSDGEHNALTATSPEAAAAAAKSAGTVLITIGLATNATAADTLRAMASRPELYFPAPTAADLQGVVNEVAGEIGGGGEITELEIIDLLPPEVEYVAGSAWPEPSRVQPGSLAWSQAALAQTGWTARYRVRPLVEGTYSPNKLAYVDYRDGDGSAATRTFPLPMITVTRRPELRTYLPLLYRGYCRAGRPFDVVLALDTSSSMRGEKLTRTRAAAREFLQFLEMPPSTAAVMAFNEGATVVQDLSASRAEVQAALDRLPTGEGTRIDLALREATRVLTRPGRDAGHAPVIVLITDGQQRGAPEQEALNAAAGARRAGVTIYTIGIGPDAAQDLLIPIAGDPARYFPAPATSDLRRIYREIAGALPCLAER